MPQLYLDEGETQHITANLPRIVCDLPYFRRQIAEHVNFSHESIWPLKKLTWTQQ